MQALVSSTTHLVWNPEIRRQVPPKLKQTHPYPTYVRDEVEGKKMSPS